MKDKHDIKTDQADLFKMVEKLSEYDNSTLIGKLCYLWQWRFFFQNYGKTFKLKDIPKGRKKDGAEYVYNEFDKYWQAEVIRARKANRNPSLYWPIFHLYGFRMLILTIFHLIGHFAMIQQALYVEDLIRSYNELNEGRKNVQSQIIYTSLIMCFLLFIQSNFLNIFEYYASIITLRTQIGLSQIIYRKSLKLSNSAMGETSTGQIVNFFSSDISRIDYFFCFTPYPLVNFTLLVYAIIKLWKNLSYFTFFGVIFLAILVSAQTLIGNIWSKMRLKATECTDERLRLINEFLNAIKIIKFYAWEHHFAGKIDIAREKEIAKLRNSLYLYSISVGLLFTITKLVLYIILVTFYVSGGLIDDETVFLTLCVFNLVTYLFTNYFQKFIMRLSNFCNSISRINKFMALEEKCEIADYKLLAGKLNNIDMLSIKKNGTSDLAYDKHNRSIEKYTLQLENVTASYTVLEGIEYLDFTDDESKKSKKNFDAIKNIDLNCKPNELTIVVGKVGSGKSSLLQTVLSELLIRKGSIEVNGRLSYACQEPWMFAGTVRENILFESDFDQEKYDEVIKVCALERDLTLFQDGDQTFIGENGVGLSGGQKARINLARALYFDADIYLLDDPLSAVDAQVCKNIFKNAINKFLNQKTVILVTHQINYIKYADKVMFLKDGMQLLLEEGSKAYKMLTDQPDSEFSKFIMKQIDRTKSEKQQFFRQDSIINGSQRSIIEPQSLENLLLIDDEPISDEEYVKNVLNEINKSKKENRIQEEDDQVRFVYKAYYDYFRYGKIQYWGPILLAVFILTQLFSTSYDLFLKQWTDSIKVSKNSTQKSDNFLIRMVTNNSVLIYSAIILLFFIFSLLRSILLSIFSMGASVNIHKNLLMRIVRAKMKFFYNNPGGVILNRFSHDCAQIDCDLPYYSSYWIEIVINNLAIITVMTISNPFLVLPFSIFIMCVLVYRMLYMKTARTIQTLVGVAKSPMIGHLSSTLNSLSTVRAFQKEDKMIKRFQKYQNDHTAIHFMSITSYRWFIYVLDNLQLVLVSGSFMVLVRFAENLSGSLIGLIVTYVLAISCHFKWCIFSWSTIETQLCSVDRIERLAIDLETDDKNNSLSEPPLESSEEAKPADSWPQNGVIEFRNVTLRYYENEDPVLKNFNFTVNSADKIGIVGRTGAGKSSIVSALFRLTEYDGTIIIDDIDCKSIGLHDLRGRISIIPQEPVLFTGTVRSNLDPIGLFEDHKLWNALKAVQLEKVINELEGGLDSKVIDNGGNFSVGQKQLICLARAILKENKILVLDEATANCDPKTDELIQATIRTVFNHCTILTIAHRLNTIMDSTKVLVLDAGEIKEYDSPYCLLQNDAGLFTSLVNACGEEQANELRKSVQSFQAK